MNAISFDTPGATRNLRDAGFEERQAEAVVRVVWPWRWRPWRRSANSSESRPDHAVTHSCWTTV